jgi:hypothetical protein
MSLPFEKKVALVTGTGCGMDLATDRNLRADVTVERIGDSFPTNCPIWGELKKRNVFR